jgi:transcription elongation GreA/GreB family factor
MHTSRSVQCATCEIEVAWPTVKQAGRHYCCAGCAAGGPCSCSYDEHPQPEVSVAALNLYDSGASATVHGLPMTREVFHRLEAEVGRLADSLPAVAAPILVGEFGEELVVGTVPAAWEFHVGTQRLNTLRRVLAAARVVNPNGTAVVGSRVLVRDDDGSLDTYTLVAPSEADARMGSISSDSPLGRALLAGC